MVNTIFRKFTGQETGLKGPRLAEKTMRLVRKDPRMAERAIKLGVVVLV